jgi:pyruvate ferredoxin oxidoreductase alpha subunit
MNTGGQLSYTTPYGKATTTSHVGKRSHGKAFHHKDTAAIMAATGIPYVFTAIEGLGTDLVEKAAKAQYFARNEGLAFGKILVTCPLNWGSEERLGYEILRRAADCCFFPLYEIQHGLTTLSYDPEKEGRKVPVSAWLELMGKSQHLLKSEHSEALTEFQQEVDCRWRRLKAMAEHPLL